MIVVHRQVPKFATALANQRNCYLYVVKCNKPWPRGVYVQIHLAVRSLFVKTRGSSEIYKQVYS